MLEINPKQITFARVRRRLSKSYLAKELGMTSRSLQNYETGASTPDATTLEKIAKLLNFPQRFFFMDKEMPEISEHAVSFRKQSKMSDTMKACTFAVCAIAFQVNQWLEERFHLPQADLPDLSDLAPEEAATTLRRMWGLGNQPIGNMIHLLESKGIRVFSLVEETREVDAFCTWYDGKPFIFLNTMKSAERSRFDAAHELGHLVRDLYTMQHGTPHSLEMEQQANTFAACFLMPRESVVTNQPPVYTINYLMKLKHNWGVSLAALVYRFNTLGLISEWNHRRLCADIARCGYRTNEPEPMKREVSQLMSRVMEILSTQKKSHRDIAESLNLHVNEIYALMFQLTKLSVIAGGASRPSTVQRAQPELRVITSVPRKKKM